MRGLMNYELDQVPEPTGQTDTHTHAAHSQLASVGLAQARPNHYSYCIAPYHFDTLRGRGIESEKEHSRNRGGKQREQEREI